MPRSPRPSLPDLAPYLEKLRDFSPGQILLGFVGVHGCFARALGSRRETPGLRRPGPGPAVSVPSTVQPSLSRANTHTLGPASPGRAPLRLSVGTVVSALPPPAPLCLSPSPSCGLGAAASQVPGCAAARGEAERAEEGGPCSGRQAAARPPLRLHTRCSAPPEPRLRRRQRPVTLRGRVGTGARGGLAVTPLCVTLPPRHRASLRTAPGTRPPGIRWPKEQSPCL